MRRLLLASVSGLAIACGADVQVFGEPGPLTGTGGTATVSASGTGGSGGSTGATTSTADASSSGNGSSSSTTVTTTTTTTVASSSTSGGGITCGNGMIDNDEGCDDGNATSGDGCDSKCKLEGNANECSASTATIQLVDEVVIAASTNGLKDITSTNCGGTSAGDAVYRVLPTKNGPVSIELATSQAFDRVLSVRPACNGSQGTYYCGDNNTMLQAKFNNVLQGVPFFIVVSGHNGSTGDFLLTIQYL